MWLAAIRAFFGGWRLWAAIGAAAVVAGAGAYVWYLKHEASKFEMKIEALQEQKGALQSDLAAALGAAAANARELEAATVLREAELRAVRGHYEEILADITVESERKAEASNAPESDDGPVAPVLRRILDRLRLGPGSVPLHGDDTDRGAPGQGAGRLPAVPGPSPAARWRHAEGRGGLHHRPGCRRGELPEGAGACAGMERLYGRPVIAVSARP